jgi:hypothetical protein
MPKLRQKLAKDLIGESVAKNDCTDEAMKPCNLKIYSSVL